MLAEAIDRPANAAARLIRARLFNPVPVIACIPYAFRCAVFLISLKSGNGKSASQKKFRKSVTHASLAARILLEEFAVTPKPRAATSCCASHTLHMLVTLRWCIAPGFKRTVAFV
jgi:hypothetical protein